MKNKILFLSLVLLLIVSLAYANNEVYTAGKYGAENFGSGDVPITFTTNPTVSVTATGATISATTREVATCRISATDGASFDDMANFCTTGGVSSHSHEVGGLTAGASYTYFISCRDTNNNIASSTVSFTTGSSGGGGSGGSGGGTASASVVGQSAKELWASVKEGESVTLKVDNGAIGVSAVTIKADKTTYGVWLEVESVSTLPDEVTAHTGKVYKNVQITGGNTENLVNDKSKAIVKFPVKKTWLIDNKVDKNNVALLRYADGKWGELTTTMDSDDGTYVHYTALTPGLSYFAIGEKSGAVPVTKAKLEEMKKEVAAAKPIKAPVQKAPSAAAIKGTMNKGWIIAVVVAVIVVGLVVGLLVKRKKSERRTPRQSKSSTVNVSKNKSREKIKH